MLCRFAKLPRLLAVLGMMVPMTAVGGRYPTSGVQSFTGGPITDLGDGTVIASTNNGRDGNPAAVVVNNLLRLTESRVNYTNASFKLPDLDPGRALQSWDISLQVRMDVRTFATPADGWALNIGPIPEGNGDGEGGYAMAGGLVIAFDTYNNGGDPPGIEVFANGVSVGNFPLTFRFSTSALRDLVIHWDASGLDLTYTVDTTPVVICTNLPTPGYAPAAGHRFAFTARTGGSSQGTYLDNLRIMTQPFDPLDTGGPVIAEFAADNGSSLEDENGENSDWIEIYNGSSSAVDLSGWSLTDAPVTPRKWIFPAMTIPAYGHLVVFASAKNRLDPAHPLHTNFGLAKAADYLALVRPDGSVASAFNYGLQAQDVTYGLMKAGTEVVYGYLDTPTPGRTNTGLQAEGPPAEEVVFLRDGAPAPGGVFASNFQLALAAPVMPGSVVRYTLDNTMPSAGSPVYATPIAVNATTTVRARVFSPGQLPGPVGSRTFLLLDSSLANYHGSGQPFSSSLPIVVLDSFGVPVDNYNSASQPRPFRLTYGVAIAPSPAGKAVITGPADFQGRGGTHVRGESSANFPQRSYGWELWDNDNEDKPEPLLGFPAESDWVLHAPYTDKTLMRNFLSYECMRALNGNGAAMGVRFVEVFFNQDGGTVSEADYRGVYVLVEKIKRDASRVDVAKLNASMTDPAVISGGYLFKRDKPGIGDVSFDSAVNNVPFQFVEPGTPNPEQKAWLIDHVNRFEAALAGSSFTDPAGGYSAYIDPLSFIDNQWFVEITKQIDGYRFSTYFTKDRNERIRCAPIWDYNLSLFNANYNGGDVHTGWYHSVLGSADYYYWPRLHQDPNYRILHWDRYWELRRGIFRSTAILDRIDELATQVVGGSTTPVTNSMASGPPTAENPAMRHFRRWPVLGTYLWPNPNNYQARTKYWNGPSRSPATYTAADAEVDAMKSFLVQRLGWIDDQNVSGTTIYRPPVLSLNGGHVAAGTPLTILRQGGSAPSGYSYANGGTLYYTTDGSDPRSPSGSPAGTAYQEPLVLTTSTTVKARLYANGNWTPLASAGFIVDAVPAAAANLVISELCYRPATPDPGSAEYQAGFTSGNAFEYIELLNVGSVAVDLSGCRLAGGISYDFGSGDPARLTLPSGGRVLVVGDTTAFKLRYGSDLTGRVLGAFDGNLSNSGETINLLAADGGVIASLTYGIAPPWPLPAYEAGYSLVLDDPAPMTGYQAGNFRESAQPGGTPGGASGPAFAGDPTADRDGDGHPDFLEYATGSSPTDANSIARPIAGEMWVFDGEHSLSYPTLSFRRSNAVDGVTFTPQYSDNLSDWQEGTATMVPVDSINHGDGTSTLIYRATVPISQTSLQLVRLKASIR